MNTAEDVRAQARTAHVRTLPMEPVGPTGEAWSRIIPFGVPADLPDFPLQALPNVVRSQVVEVAESRCISPDYPATTALGAMAAACARIYEVHIGDTHREPTNLFTLSLMDSGERKSGAFEDIMFPVAEYQTRLRADAAPEIRRAEEHVKQEEERLKVLRHMIAKEKEAECRLDLEAQADRIVDSRTIVPAIPTLLVRDATPEYVAMVMAANGSRIAQVDPEGGTFFKMIGGQYSKDGQSNFELYLSGHCGERFDVGRVTRGALAMEKPAITLVLSGQPDVLKRLKDNQELRARGMFARFLFSLPKSCMGERFYKNRRINSEVREAYAAMMRCALETKSVATKESPDACRPLRISDEALAVWTSHHDETERSLGPEGSLHAIRDWMSKLSGAVARIAGLLHVMAGASGGVISAQTVSDAWQIGHYFRAHALGAFALMDGDEAVARARRVLAWIRRHGRQTFRLAEVYDDLRHGGDTCSSADLESPLADLVDRNYIRAEPAPIHPRGRPPSPGYEVNPLTHEAGGRSA